MASIWDGERVPGTGEESYLYDFVVLLVMFHDWHARFHKRFCEALATLQESEMCTY